MQKRISLPAGALIILITLCAPAVALSAVLYDNGPLVNSAGTGAGGADESVLQRTALGMFNLGFGISSGNRAADDFIIPDPDGWDIQSITFYAYQTFSGTASTITAINLRIWDGPPDDPASAVVFGDASTNLMSSTSWSNIYRVDDTTGGNTDRPVMAVVADAAVTLAQGTYWLDWQADGSLASGPWAPPVTIDGQTSTGNGMLYDGSAWAPALDTGVNAVQGFPFIIEGTVKTAPPPPPSTKPIPTASEWGMIILISVLALASIVKIRRNQS